MSVEPTSKVALDAIPMWPSSPGLANTRLKESLNTGLWKVSLCTDIPPVCSTAIFISAKPTYRRGEESGSLAPYCAYANRES